MNIVKEETVWFDVDSTLVFSHEGDIVIDYYGEQRSVRPHKEHISFLKSLKARGYHVKVHSNNGWKWAANVVMALGLQNYVDEVLTKPYKVIDDEQPEAWLPQSIYIKETK